VSLGDETAVVTAGVANVRSAAPVLRNTIFPIGSVTKIYQATLLLSLGLDIDEPVRRYLPEFRAADAAASDAVTVRDLLTHSSGLESDHVPDFGWGDDAVRLYVESCASLGQLHPPGLLTSYCNSGVVVGGRIVEILDGATWDESLRSRLLTLYELDDTVSLPQDAILRPVAVGHFPTKDGPVVAPVWSWPRAIAPCGGTLAASAPDVLRFARLHLRRDQRIGSEIAYAMSELQRRWPEGIATDDIAHLDGIGLGWFLWDWGGTRVLGHDGTGLGSAAGLRLIPDQDMAIVCLANAWYGGFLLRDDLLRAVIEDEAGLSTVSPQVTGNPHPSNRYLGTYRRLNAEISILEGTGGQVKMRKSFDGLGYHDDQVYEQVLKPVGADLFRGRSTLYGEDVYRFVDTDADGRPNYLYERISAYRRVDGKREGT
jgi:CubicO group peptidase (beta-lactamase class C family)